MPNYITPTYIQPTYIMLIYLPITEVALFFYLKQK